MKKKTMRVLLCVMMMAVMVMVMVSAVPAFAAGDVAGAIENTWNLVDPITVRKRG